MVAGAEAQERRGAVAEMGEHELAGRAVVERQRRPRVGVDQLRVDEAAGAEMHPVLRFALAPERDADVADPHRLGHPRSPSALLHLRPERRLAAAGLTGDEDPLHGRSSRAASRPRSPAHSTR